MDEELAKILKVLRLPGLQARWDAYMALAQTEDFSPVRLLRHVLEEEAKIKQDNAYKLRLKRACIPELFVMETFPFDRQPKLNKKKILSLYDAFDFIQKNENIIWLGLTGRGKTGLATSFLVEAIRRGYTGRSIPFLDLLTHLYASVADHSEEKVLKRYLSYDCLLIDEVGYVEVETAHINLFFTLMHRRNKKRSTLITSNLGFSEWGSFLKSPQITDALIDRLTECSHVINMKGCKTLRSPLDKDE